jgi:hypothetical protein
MKQNKWASAAIGAAITGIGKGQNNSRQVPGLLSGKPVCDVDCCIRSVVRFFSFRDSYCCCTTASAGKINCGVKIFSRQNPADDVWPGEN